jgi:hypothetical protein
VITRAEHDRQVRALRAELTERWARLTLAESTATRLAAQLSATTEQLAAPPLVTSCTNVDQARGLLAAVSERLGQLLDEREELLAYVLARTPAAALPTAHPDVMRELLPNDRHSCVKKLRINAKGTPEHISAHLFMGFYDDGRLGELFIQLGREHRDGPAGGGYHLAAKMGSLALQHHCLPGRVVRQMRFQHDASGGRPYGPTGPLLPPAGPHAGPTEGVTVSSLTDYIGIMIGHELAARGRPITEDSDEPTPPPAPDAGRDPHVADPVLPLGAGPPGPDRQPGSLRRPVPERGQAHVRPPAGRRRAGHAHRRRTPAR